MLYYPHIYILNVEEEQLRILSTPVPTAAAASYTFTMPIQKVFI